MVARESEDGCMCQRVRRTVQTWHVLAAASAGVLCLQVPEAVAQESPDPLGAASPVVSQPDAGPYEGLLIREVRIEGLSRVDLQLIRNQLRTSAGAPYSGSTIDMDVRSLTRLNQFRRIRVDASLVDGGVLVTFALDEWALIADVQVTGNTRVSDQEISEVVILRADDPLDTFQLNQARERIAELYQKRGYYLVQVEIDQPTLVESNIVLFRVREGPRVKIREIDFRGNKAFSSRQLGPNIQSKTSVFLLRTGEIDSDLIEDDIRRVREFYRDRGYLDVRVDRAVDVSNDLKEAKLVFVIDEGPLYRLRDIQVEGATRLQEKQLKALMPIKTGDTYAADKIRSSRIAVENGIGRLGYPDVNVEIDELRDEVEPLVDLVLKVNQGDLAYAGEVRVVGNSLTKREVILRAADVRPNRPLSPVDLSETQRKIQQTRLFGQVSVTAQDPDPEEPLYRDVLIEVEETNTGNIGFGIGVSSDTSIFGAIDVTQRNFDVADVPESWSELWSGRAFRGAGQTASLTLQPGTEVSNYAIGLTEPYLFGSDYSGSASGSYTTRILESYDETRWGGRLSVGRRFGEVWNVAPFLRAQNIDLSDIESTAPVDVFEVEGSNFLTGLGVAMTRTTYDNRFRPSRGTRLEMLFEQVGLFGGDFDFSKAEVDYQVYLPVYEDFLGRKSVLSFQVSSGYIFSGDTPIYERYFLGGRSFRGFDYRTVSPKGVRNDNGKVGVDPVGGEFRFFLGTEYNVPLIDQFMSGVIFVDSGTVTDDAGFEDYRVSAGFGIRLYIEQLSQAPLAFDFGFPLVKEEKDNSQLFSFSVDLPF